VSKELIAPSAPQQDPQPRGGESDEAAADRAVDRRVGQRGAELRDLAVRLAADERVASDERLIGAEVGLAEVDPRPDAVAAGVPEVG